MDLLLAATPSQDNYNWTSFWNLKIPPWVHSFLWRLAHQCLPTRANLTTRGIPCEDSCVSCKLLAETHMYTFFVCSKATDCWEKIGLGNLIRNLLLTADNFTTTLFNLFDKLSLHHQHLAAMLLWSLWKSCNASYGNLLIHLLVSPSLMQKTPFKNGVVCREQNIESKI